MLRGVGAGDVKLMAALGAILGPRNWMALFILPYAATIAVAALEFLIIGNLGIRTH